MKKRIPKENADLRQYVLRRRILQLLAYGVWIAVFFTGALSYNAARTTYPPERLILGWRLLLWMSAGVVIGFFLFRIGRLFKLRAIEGTVERSGLSNTYEASSDPGVASSINYDFRSNTYLVIRTPSGKRRKLRFEQKQGFYLYYYEGSYLCRLSGLPYPVCDPARQCRPRRRPTEDAFHHDDPSNGYVCAACGRFSPTLHSPCPKCGHSLVDPEALFAGDRPTDGDLKKETDKS